MGWKTVGRVSHVENGQTWVRRVARNSDTGETERTFGLQRHMTREATSRSLGKTLSDDEALRISKSDLKSTFR